MHVLWELDGNFSGIREFFFPVRFWYMLYWSSGDTTWEHFAVSTQNMQCCAIQVWSTLEPRILLALQGSTDQSLYSDSIVTAKPSIPVCSMEADWIIYFLLHTVYVGCKGTMAVSMVSNRNYSGSSLTLLEDLCHCIISYWSFLVI